LQGLDFLPRQPFLEAIVGALKGNTAAVRTTLLAEIEQATFTFLPGPISFKPDLPKAHGYSVNPDGVIETPSAHVMVEAKRISSGSFQAEQLAREFVIVARETNKTGRRPLLLLVLGHAPPVSIAGAGQQMIDEAIRSKLKAVLKKVASPLSYEALDTKIDGSVAWITWQTIAKVLHDQLETFKANSGTSAYSAVERIAQSVISAIASHQ